VVCGRPPRQLWHRGCRKYRWALERGRRAGHSEEPGHGAHDGRRTCRGSKGHSAAARKHSARSTGGRQRRRRSGRPGAPSPPGACAPTPEPLRLSSQPSWSSCAWDLASRH
jgi:hypothetical protein